MVFFLFPYGDWKRSATFTSPSCPNLRTRSAPISTSSHSFRPNHSSSHPYNLGEPMFYTVDLRSLMIGQWPWYLGTLEKLAFGLPEQDYWRVDRPRAQACQCLEFPR